MVEFTHGLFLDKIPYAKSGTGPKKAVVFPGSMDLILSIALNPKNAVKERADYFSSDYTYYILGYDRNLPAGATFDSIAGDFGTIIEKEIGKATVIGTSYGGFIAARLASLFPHLVEKVILISSACGLSDTGMVFAKNLMTALDTDKYPMAINELASLFTSKVWRSIVKFAGPFLKGWIYKRRNPASTLVNAYKALLNSQVAPEDVLPTIAAPTAILGGTKDRVFSVAIYQKTASLIPNCTLHLFEGAGHMLETVKRKEFLGALLPHLST